MAHLMRPQREDVSGAPGVFLLSNVLTEDECDQIVALSEQMGYCPDAPVSLSREIRQNDNCVWLADEQSLNKVVFDRCKHLLPEFADVREFVCSEEQVEEVRIGPVTGLNQRWRLYRYNASDVFRPHTDGSWPGSGLSRNQDWANSDLVQDLYDGRQHSLLTFLIYLNDDCEGGETSFYYDVRQLAEIGVGGRETMLETPAAPEAESAAELVKVSVRPKKGGILCFWHGQHPWSPLHEGSKVERGVKYVVRTDVLYKVDEHWGRFFRALHLHSARQDGRSAPNLAEAASRKLQSLAASGGASSNGSGRAGVASTNPNSGAAKIGNLSVPDERINSEPCLLLFLDDAALPATEKSRLASLVAEYAMKNEGENTTTDEKRLAVPVFVAVSPNGAVPQIRGLLSLAEESGGNRVRFVLLDIPGRKFASYQAEGSGGQTKMAVESCGELEEWIAEFREGKVGNIENL
eukprot:g18502.t1